MANKSCPFPIPHPHNNQFLRIGMTCGSLLHELEMIWNEVGECDDERDKRLLELEQECLEVYRRKINKANQSRVKLRQSIADAQTELSAICSAMGEQPMQMEQNAASLNEQLSAIIPQLGEMRKRKCDRWNQFLEVTEQIWKISNEIFRPVGCKMIMDESDLSLLRLEELQRQLQTLKKEKSDHLKQVLDRLSTLNSFCSVLGMDFKHTIDGVHPSLDNSEGSADITTETIEKLADAVQSLRGVEIERMKRLQDLTNIILKLWELMDVTIVEKQMFQDVVSKIDISEHEIREPAILSLDLIHSVEAEVLRPEKKKSSKIKDLVLKWRLELEDICRQTHIVAGTDWAAVKHAIIAIESGAVDPNYILEQIEAHLSKVKEEALGRKEIVEMVNKWLAACEEECWLEEYNRDEKRYNTGWGACVAQKHAEKARVTVTKLPATLEVLVSKTTEWEKEKGTDFIYDSVRLLSMVEENSILWQNKKKERQSKRENRTLQRQPLAEQKALYESKPGPLKKQKAKKVPRTSIVSANRRSSGAKFQYGSAAGAVISHPRGKSGQLQPNDSLISQQENYVAAFSSGERGSDISGIPIKQHCAHAREVDASIQRKPLTPVPALSLNVNTINMQQGVAKSTNGASLKNVPINSTMNSPSNWTSVTDIGNRTPKASAI